MQIGELAGRNGTTPSAIRFYEKQGVLPAPARSRGKRAYSGADENSLRLVLALQAAGFTLREIRELLSIPAPGRTRAVWRERVRVKLVELDAEVQRLTVARERLVGALDCRCKGNADACALATPVNRGSARALPMG